MLQNVLSNPRIPAKQVIASDALHVFHFSDRKVTRWTVARGGDPPGTEGAQLISRFESLLTGSDPAGCFGQTIQLNGGPLEVGWLRLGACGFFGVFSSTSPASTESALLLGGGDSAAEREHLEWFVQRVLVRYRQCTGYGDAIRHIELATTPAMIVAGIGSENNRPAGIDLVTVCFAQAFLKITRQGRPLGYNHHRTSRVVAT